MCRKRQKKEFTDVTQLTSKFRMSLFKETTFKDYIELGILHGNEQKFILIQTSETPYRLKPFSELKSFYTKYDQQNKI